MDWLKKQFTGQSVLIILVLGLYIQNYISNYNLQQEIMYAESMAKSSADDAAKALIELEEVKKRLEEILEHSQKE